MRISNFGIGVLHVKVKYWRIFFVTSFLCSLKFLLFHRIEYHKRCLCKKNLWLSFCDNFVIVPVKLTIDLWRSIFQWIEYNPISIMYKFQIDISSNSREIKYQNIGRAHRHTCRQTHIHRQTDWVKTIPRNPLRGRGKYVIWSYQPWVSQVPYHEIPGSLIVELSRLNISVAMSWCRIERCKFQWCICHRVEIWGAVSFSPTQKF